LTFLMKNKTTKQSRWGRLGSLNSMPALGEMFALLGSPEVHVGEEFPKYTPGVFQVLITETSIYIHAPLYRRWGNRQAAKFIADCNSPQGAKALR